MIGSLPCEVSLDAILTKENNPKISSYVASKYNKFRHGLDGLRPLKFSDDGLYITMCRLLREDAFRRIETSFTNQGWPKIIKTHLLCCLTARYRRVINAEEKQDETDRHTD
jgi:hypothetical protein